MRKINVLGVRLKDYSVREAMRRISLYLNNGICNTVDFVNRDTLLLASNDETLRSTLESMDLVVITSNDILEAANFHSRTRKREIESNLFLKGLLWKLSKEGRPVFLISETTAKLENLTASLHSFFGKLKIVSSVARSETVGGDDFLVNELNSSLPDVVIVNLDTPEAESFIQDNKMKINAQLVVILRDYSLKVDSDGYVKTGGIGEFVLRKIFRRAADNYEKR